MSRALTMLVVALALAASAPAALMANIQVTDAWARATPGTSSTAAVYFTITNAGSAADKLISAETEAAETAELHETTLMGGMMHMGQSKTIDIPAGGKVTFAPNGRHLMLMRLMKPLRKGDAFTVTLHFEKAGAVAAKVQVLGVAALGPQHGH